MILSKILHQCRISLEESKRKLPLEQMLQKLPPQTKKYSFKHAISKPHTMNLIAEVKRSSPSKGVIVKDYDPAKIAQIYYARGAAAISVLTEERYFEGKITHIKDVKDAIPLPVLRKDFIIDEYQVYEAAYYGADAILLIADILSEEEMERLFSKAKEQGLDVLVEVHKEADIEKALKIKADIIGINNRDLHTFKTDLDTTTRLIRLIPKEKTIVSESGIKTKEDIAFMRSLGVKAVLIGEAFLSSPDISEKIKQVMGR